MADQSRVQEILNDMLDSDRTPEEACAQSPELLEAVRVRWDKIRRVRLQIDECFPSDALTECQPSPMSAIELPAIDGYAVESVLGRGGMGVVFKARQVALNRNVAIKMLLSGPYAGMIERARFRREAEAAAALRHPNIVQIYDAGDAAGQNFLVMELVDGGTLAEKLAGKPLPPREACELVAILAAAVQFAHQIGFVHRDIKPSNILLTGDGIAKITDFGLARSIDSGPEFTLSGARVGTPSYMAPEQALGKSSAIGPAADVYSLGAVLYETLTGRPPFVGTSAAETERQVIAEDPTPPRQRNPNVPRDLEVICLKCLAKNPVRRYASAQGLADDLQRFLSGEAIAARPEGRAERLVRTLRRRPALAVAASAAVLLFGAFGVAWLWVGSEQSARQAATSKLNQVDRERRDREFSARLDAIRLARTAVVDGTYESVANSKLNKDQTDKAYEAAFHEAGFAEVFDDPSAVAARLSETTIRESLIAALDDWAACAAEPRRRDWLLETADRASVEPTQLRHRLRDPAVWDDRGALAELGEQGLAEKHSARLLVLIGERMRDTGADGLSYMTRVQRLHPDDFWANFVLADVVRTSNPKMGVRYLQAALALRPQAAVVWNNLGRALVYDGRWDEAILYLRRAVELEPTFSQAHSNLGIALKATKRPAEALVHHERAVRFGSQHAATHLNFGVSLMDAGRVDEATREFEEALRLDPDYSMAYAGLGSLLQQRGKLDEAVEHFRTALRIHPQVLVHHLNLGFALTANYQPAEALQYFETVLRIDGNNVNARTGLANALGALERYTEAIGHYEKAAALDANNPKIEIGLSAAMVGAKRFAEALTISRKLVALDPENAKAHYCIGQCYEQMGQIDDALASLDRARQLDPKFVDAQGLFGLIASRIGRFAEAKQAIERWLEQSPQGEPRREAFERKAAWCGRMLALEPRLPDVLAGRDKPEDVADSIDLADLCRMHKQHAAAAGLFADAFAAAPELASRPGIAYRAACSAAIAGNGPMDRKTPLGASERARWRGQALAWLRADLSRLTGKTGDLAGVRKTLLKWQADNDLACVRDGKAIAALPEKERESWRTIWEQIRDLLSPDVNSLLAQARACVDRGEWAKAEEFYHRLRFAVEGDGEYWFEYAAAQLLAGDRDGYEQTCRHMLADTRIRPYLVARAFTLSPIATEDRKALTQRTTEELTTYGLSFWSLTEQAALKIRMEDAKGAVSLCQKSLAADAKPGTQLLNRLWLAFAFKQRGDADQARESMAKAVTWLDSVGDHRPAEAESRLGLHRHNWLEAQVLRRELEEKNQPNVEK